MAPKKPEQGIWRKLGLGSRMYLQGGIGSPVVVNGTEARLGHDKLGF